jgi:hypothetical protein
MSITLIGGSETIVSSDAEWQLLLPLKTEATMDETEEDSKKNGSDFSERYV